MNTKESLFQGKHTMESVYFYVEMLAKSESGRRLVNILPKLMVTKGRLETSNKCYRVVCPNFGHPALTSSFTKYIFFADEKFVYYFRSMPSA